MRRPVKLFLWVLSISFAGSLPPGTLNTGVTDLVVNRGGGAAIRFGLGAILVEAALVRVALMGMSRLRGWKKMEGWKGVRRLGRWVRLSGWRWMERWRWLEKMKRVSTWGGVLACVIVLLLAVISLKGASHRGGGAVSLWGDRPLLSGLLLSLLNPLHLPFWIGWIAVLRSRGVLGNTVVEGNVFVCALGLGTALAFIVYGSAGHFFIGWLQVNKALLNWLIALTLLVTGLLQLYRILFVNQNLNI